MIVGVDLEHFLTVLAKNENRDGGNEGENILLATYYNDLVWSKVKINI